MSTAVKLNLPIISIFHQGFVSIFLSEDNEDSSCNWISSQGLEWNGEAHARWADQERPDDEQVWSHRISQEGGSCSLGAGVHPQTLSFTFHRA
jgi:hypothetical protein